jgi:hypothetical protein
MTSGVTVRFTGKTEVFSGIGRFSMGYMRIKSPQVSTTTPENGLVAIVRPNLISKRELAQRLSVSPRTIDNWSRQKLIPVHRFSSRLIRYDASKVESALEKYEIREVGRVAP